MVKKAQMWMVFVLCVASSLVSAAENRAVNEVSVQQLPSKAKQFNKAILDSREAAAKNNYRAAIKFSLKSLALGEALLTEKPEQLAALNYNHGVLLSRGGRYAEAGKQLQKALSNYETIYGKESAELRPLIYELATSLGKARQPSSSQYFRRALKLAKRHHGSPSLEYARLLIQRGVILSYYFPRKNGKSSLVKGRKMAVSLEGEASQLAGWASFHLGKLAMARRDWDSSTEHLLAALNTFDLPDEPANSIELSTHAFLVQAFSEQNEQALATRHCLAIGRMTPFTPDQDYLPIYKQQPEYPRSALRRRQSGWSIVEFDVDDQGFVRDPRIVQKSSATFDKASIAAASNFRYAPAFDEGKAVATRNVQNKIIYTIAD